MYAREYFDNRIERAGEGERGRERKRASERRERWWREREREMTRERERDERETIQRENWGRHWWASNRQSQRRPSGGSCLLRESEQGEIKRQGDWERGRRTVLIYMYSHVYRCIYMHIYLYIYIHTCVYLCMYIYTYICINVNDYTYTHIYKWERRTRAW